ncbi:MULTISPECIES: RNA recognition motif domain-containing protein [Thalassotalea]|uniref:RNA recognition motif domain-containing protein n=1 Tax=Thalassotalea TaxID=1518149 RepID=UPI0009421179|nr:MULTISPECIES: RNA-binding protein [Thalassotalea]OKY27405.1 RNA-binding protein [Thalassotalea sp. PP2-459]
MTSPKTTQIVAAIIFAIIVYFIAISIELSPAIVATIAFVCSILTSLLGSEGADNATGDVKTLYVGNLPYRANEGAVRALFSEYGKVHSVRLMKDKHTGKRRGFGFVEMASNDADGAIKQLNDSEFQQRTLKVREAKERPEKQHDDE